MMSEKKRQSNLKAMCKYGDQCYQQNAEHRRKYIHPSPQPTEKVADKDSDVPKIPSKKTPKRKCEPNSEEVSLKLDKVQSNDQVRECSPAVKNNGTSSVSQSKCPADLKAFIKDKFLVEMPSDFYDFWDFCCSLDPENPSEAFSELELDLVGPYDVLSNKITDDDIEGNNILRHYRYFYDPPEFQTVIAKKGDDLYHIGYFRDDPKEMPSCLASNSAAIDPVLKLVGDNIFAAMNFELTTALQECPKRIGKKFMKVKEELQEFAEKMNYSLESTTTKTKARSRKIVAKTFHNFGIVVPVDKARNLGYRPLICTNAKLMKILGSISRCETEDLKTKNRAELDEIQTCIQFANDECDYGTGLELGIDLFCFGDPYFHHDVLLLLKLAYNLLHRSEYGEILTEHLKHRVKTDKVSIKDRDH